MITLCLFLTFCKLKMHPTPTSTHTNTHTHTHTHKHTHTNTHTQTHTQTHKTNKKYWGFFFSIFSMIRVVSYRWQEKSEQVNI